MRRPRRRQTGVVAVGPRPRPPLALTQAPRLRQLAGAAVQGRQGQRGLQAQRERQVRQTQEESRQSFFWVGMALVRTYVEQTAGGQWC